MKSNHDTLYTILGVIGVGIIAVVGFILVNELANNLNFQPTIAAPAAGQFSGTGTRTFPTGGLRRQTQTVTPAALNPTDTPAAETAQPTPTATVQPSNTPLATATNNKTFSLVSLSPSVMGGTNASAQIVTTPNANCVLIFQDPSGKVVNAAGTGQTQANVNGTCSWTWQVPPLTTQGTGTVSITVDQYTLSYSITIR